VAAAEHQTQNGPDAERITIDYLAADVAKHEALVALIADLKKQADESADKIKAALGEYVVGTIAGVDRVSLPYRTRKGGIDGTAVKALLTPEQLARVTKPDTGYRPLIHLAGEADPTA
jgi:hypothetical protein